jgi:hypothetical protein
MSAFGGKADILIFYGLLCQCRSPRWRITEPALYRSPRVGLLASVAVDQPVHDVIGGDAVDADEFPRRHPIAR